MFADGRSLKDEIESESARLREEFLPYLDAELEKARERTSLVLCLCRQDPPPDYFPSEQALKSHVSEIISVLQAEAHIEGLILPYAYESLAIICPTQDREEFAQKIASAGEIIVNHSFGRTMPPEHLTLSFGLSSYPMDSEFADELLKHAALSLEAAVESGGNIVRAYWRLE